MARKKGLGKGLGALLDTSVTSVSNEINEENEAKIIKPKSEMKKSTRKTSGNKSEKSKNVKVAKSNESVKANREDSNDVADQILDSMQTLPVDMLDANPDQPRKEFDEQGLSELAESIKKYGILQPIVVKKHTVAGRKPYEIVAGERRFRAAKLAELAEVPVVLRESDKEETSLLAVIENVQREDLNPLEEALAYQNIMNQQMMTQQQLAEALGKSRPYIANIVRLTKLDNESMDALRKGLLTSSQARTLLAEENLTERAKIRNLFIEGKTNVGNVERKQKVKQTKDVFILDMEDRLSELLGTKVSIAKKRRGWNVSVDCYSEEDLQTILGKLEG